MNFKKVLASLWILFLCINPTVLALGGSSRGLIIDQFSNASKEDVEEILEHLIIAKREDPRAYPLESSRSGMRNVFFMYVRATDFLYIKRKRLVEDLVLYFQKVRITLGISWIQLKLHTI